MRVTSCERCARTLQAANDDDLRDVARDHLESEHGGGAGDAEIERLIATAYDAMDS